MSSCNTTDLYMNEFLMNNKICKDKYSDVDIQKYRDKFVDFRSYTCQTSGGIDTVDKMNEVILSGDKVTTGDKISNIYDSLTQNCIKNPNLDKISISPQYKMQGSMGNYYTKDNWIYGYDNVMNGGMFYDGITGQDPMMDNQMAVN